MWLEIHQKAGNLNLKTNLMNILKIKNLFINITILKYIESILHTKLSDGIITA